MCLFAEEGFVEVQVFFEADVLAGPLPFLGAADKPCGGGSADANPKIVAKRYMIA